jgi:hypothetical protein
MIHHSINPYQIHEWQATRRGLPPLPQEEFTKRLSEQHDTDLTGLLPPPAPARKKPIPKFPVGKLCITPNAASQLSAEEIAAGLTRHLLGDWGELDTADWQLNDQGLTDGGRLCSTYTTQSNVKYWIISEPDRSATTVLMPEDY